MFDPLQQEIPNLEPTIFRGELFVLGAGYSFKGFPGLPIFLLGTEAEPEILRILGFNLAPHLPSLKLTVRPWKCSTPWSLEIPIGNHHF